MTYDVFSGTLNPTHSLTVNFSFCSKFFSMLVFGVIAKQLFLLPVAILVYRVTLQCSYLLTSKSSLPLFFVSLISSFSEHSHVLDIISIIRVGSCS